MNPAPGRCPSWHCRSVSGTWIPQEVVSIPCGYLGPVGQVVQRYIRFTCRSDKGSMIKPSSRRVVADAWKHRVSVVECASPLALSEGDTDSHGQARILYKLRSPVPLAPLVVNRSLSVASGAQSELCRFPRPRPQRQSEPRDLVSYGIPQNGSESSEGSGSGSNPGWTSGSGAFCRGASPRGKRSSGWRRTGL